MIMTMFGMIESIRTLIIIATVKILIMIIGIMMVTLIIVDIDGCGVNDHDDRGDV